MTVADQAAASCPHCGSAAYVDGACATCSFVKRRTPGQRAMVRRRSKCRHPEWERLTLRHAGDEYRSEERCTSCGTRRYVEAQG